VAGKGRGVFTDGPIAKGAVIERCPVIEVPPAQVPALEATELYDYFFWWGKTEPLGAAIVGGLGMFYNHAYRPNARYVRDYAARELVIEAIEDIAPGEEVCINYQGDPKSTKAVWFDARID
jgi:SET domain-containing protein